MRCSQHLIVRGAEVLDILEGREKEVIKAAWEDYMTLLNACFILVVLNLRHIQLSWLCDFSWALSVALGRGMVWSKWMFGNSRQVWL